MPGDRARTGEFSGRYSNTCTISPGPYDERASSAAGSGGKGALAVQIHRARTIVVSAILATAALLTTVLTVLADGGTNPIPK